MKGRKDGEGEEGWKAVDEVDKSGFEDVFSLPAGGEGWVAYRVAALDKEKKVLGVLGVAEEVEGGSWSWKLFVFAIVASGLVAAVWGLRAYLRKRRGFMAGLFAWDKSGSANIRYTPL